MRRHVHAEILVKTPIAVRHLSGGVKTDGHVEPLRFGIDRIELGLAEIQSRLDIGRHHHGDGAFFADRAADFLDCFRDHLRRDHRGVFYALAAALAEIARPVVVCLGQLHDEIELAYESDGERVTRIGDGIADFFYIKISAVLLRDGRFPAGGVVQKNIPAERRKVRTAADAKTFRQIVVYKPDHRGDAQSASMTVKLPST